MKISEKSSGTAGVREIAKALGVSLGTVDRALHGRVGVSAQTRDRVMRMATQLNYTPNLAARNLKLNRRLRIGVFLPKEIASFFDLVRAGIKAAADSPGSSVEIAVHDFPRMNDGGAAALRSAGWEQYDGIILSPGNPTMLTDFWAGVARLHKPVTLVTTDVPHTERIASVSVDGTISGSVAADLLGRSIHQPASVAILTGDLRVQEHSDKLRGFAATLAQLAPHLTLLPTIENRDRPTSAYGTAKEILHKHKGLRGMYVSTANSLPVLQALRESGRLGTVQIVTTDLFPELVPLIEQGQIVATLEQRPFTQGRRALELLAGFLATGHRPKMQTRLAPHIVLRSNLPIFLERLFPHL